MIKAMEMSYAQRGPFKATRNILKQFVYLTQVGKLSGLLPFKAASISNEFKPGLKPVFSLRNDRFIS